MKNSPIALFAYNRPLHLQRTIDALRQNEEAKESELFIFSDGAKEGAESQVAEVRQIAHSVSGFLSIHIIERVQNIGLAQNIITGISSILEHYKTVIVLEDDLVTSPWFLQFMNRALELYQDEENVASVHGFVNPVKGSLPETFFMQHPSSWGWATWRRAWKYFEPDGVKLLNFLETKQLTQRFDFEGNYRFTRMLRRQIEGVNNSWAIRWYASVLVNDLYCLFPGHPLLENIGNDGSGENCFNDRVYDNQFSSEPVFPEKIAVEENTEARKLYAKYFHSIDSLPARIRIRLQRIFNNLKNKE
jgi:glycosyltransferase involved in cell wall biosynthesis